MAPWAIVEVGWGEGAFLAGFVIELEYLEDFKF